MNGWVLILLAIAGLVLVRNAHRSGRTLLMFERFFVFNVTAELRREQAPRLFQALILLDYLCCVGMLALGAYRLAHSPVR